VIVARQALLALVAVATVSGCRAGSGGLLAPPPLASRPSIEATELVERHNQNAERVAGLDALPRVVIQSTKRRGAVQLGGKMALERTRNFRMTLDTPLGRQVGDVGSNDREFWFWTNQERALYVGQYGAGGSAPADLPFQPDWIVEALGLRVISEDEARRIKVQRGSQAGTLVLTHTRDDGRGKTTIKQTQIDEQSGLVREHRFYGPDRKTVVARAYPTDYRPLKLPGTDGPETAVLPQKIKLVARPRSDETVTMDLILSDTRVNPEFTQAMRDELFTVPKKRGAEVVYLNSNPDPESSGFAAETDGPDRVHQTRSAPARGTGVELGEPAPIGVDGATLYRDDAMPRTEDDLSESEARPEAIVGSRYPRPPGEDRTVVEMEPARSPWRAGKP
jgi:hypothetical protein